MKLTNGMRVRALENLIGVPVGAEGIVVEADPDDIAIEVRFDEQTQARLDVLYGSGETAPMVLRELEVIS